MKSQNSFVIITPKLLYDNTMRILIYKPFVLVENHISKQMYLYEFLFVVYLMPSITFHISDHEYTQCMGLTKTLLKKKTNPKRTIFKMGMQKCMEEKEMEGMGFVLKLMVTKND